MAEAMRAVVVFIGRWKESWNGAHRTDACEGRNQHFLCVEERGGVHSHRVAALLAVEVQVTHLELWKARTPRPSVKIRLPPPRGRVMNLPFRFARLAQW